MTARPMRPRSDLGKRFWSALSVLELDPTPPAIFARRALQEAHSVSGRLGQKETRQKDQSRSRA